MTILCIANNTVAIIVSGSLAKELAQKNGVTAKRSASLLDITSCIVQGLIPWGAQILLLGATFYVDPFEIVLFSFYPMALAFAMVLAVFIQHDVNKPKDLG